MKRILFIFLTFCSLKAFAYEFAYTINDTTIVYADMALKMPLGYIKEGRKLVVGKSINEKNTIIPILLDGKIVFVKRTDLSFDQKGLRISSAPIVKEHRVIDIDDNYIDKLIKNTYLVLDLSSLSSGETVKNYTEALGGDEESNFIKVNIALENRIPETRSGFGVYFSYLKSSNEVVDIKTAILGGEYQYRLLKLYSATTLELYGGLFFSADISVDTNRKQQLSDGSTTRISEELYGSLWGYRYGARVRMFPYSKFSLFGNLGFSNYNTISMDFGTSSDGSTRVKLEDFGGLEIGVGISVSL